MIIYLDKENRIKGTSTSWQLEREGIYKGKPQWKPYKYFGTLAGAVQCAAEAEFRTAEAVGVVAAQDALRSLIDKYTKALSVPHLTVVVE